MVKRTLLLLVAVVAVVASNARETQREPAIFNGVNVAAMNHWVDSVMNRLSPRARAAQLMVVGVNARDDERTRATLRRLVVDEQVGGLIHHEASAADMVTATNYAQSLSRVPLLITIDGEWGVAMRVSGLPKFRRNLSVGAIDDDRVTYNYGREVARECRRMGIHVNFAPVLDVNDNPNNPVIGDRSFGESPELVARHGLAYARGLEDGGVLSVAKHFPGHGNSEEDSHKTLPVINKTMQELNTCELLPFRRYIDAGLGGMLTAHLRVPAIDDRMVPSTMSPACVTKLLRDQLGFKGLIFTDALTMKGATQALQGSACVNALLAGNDVLLMPGDVKAELDAIMAAVDAGTLTQEAIDDHCRRLLRYKYALGLSRMQLVKATGIMGDLNDGQSQALHRQLSARSITVLRNDDKVLPVRNLQSRHIAVVTLDEGGSVDNVFASRCADYASVTHIVPRVGESAQQLADRVRKGNYNLILVTAAGTNAATVEMASKLAASNKNVVLTLLCGPYDIKRYGSAITARGTHGVVVTYENTSLAQDYAAQTIFGGNAATGSLPIAVTLEGSKKRFDAGHGIHFAATRLGYGLPSEVGLSNALLAKVDSICNLGVREHAFPGCQVVIARHGKVVCNRAYGTIDYDSRVPVTTGTLFGLASVSKATGTLSAVMKAYDDGKFNLEEPASRYIPGLRGTDKEDITFRQLLFHESGMQPSLSMWEMMMDKDTYTGKLIAGQADDKHHIKIMNGAYGHDDARLRTDILSRVRTDRFNIAIADSLWGGRVTYDSIMERIYHSRLLSKTYRYSCLNFCLLADAMQRITHSPLNYFVNQYVFAPLGAYHTLYRPLSQFGRDQIAYTEVDTYLRRQHIHGYVHDELAAFSGGVQGNAGLFSSANDLAKLLQMWLNGGTYGGTRLLKASTVDVFTKQKSPNSHRGLGFDKPVIGNPDASNTCPEATPETYGHTGFTGTRFWVDPANDMLFIFLSNRVSPSRNNPAFGRISASSHIQSLIYQSIEK